MGTCRRATQCLTITKLHPYTCRNLSAWAEKEGVLLLNTCLTVQANSAGSHKDKGWEQFTDKVVEIVDKYGGANLGSGVGEGVGTFSLFYRSLTLRSTGTFHP
jgi:hypothetical protein